MNGLTKRSTALYGELTSKQQAALTLKFIANNNEVEARRVHDAVKWKHYRCKDDEYIQWRDRFTEVVMLIGLEYWQTAFKYAHVVTIAVNDEQWLPKAHQLSVKITTVQQVLYALCSENGFCFDSVTKLLDIPRKGFSPVAYDDLDGELYDQLMGNLKLCLPQS